MENLVIDLEAATRRDVITCRTVSMGASLTRADCGAHTRASAVALTVDDRAICEGAWRTRAGSGEAFDRFGSSERLPYS